MGSNCLLRLLMLMLVSASRVVRRYSLLILVLLCLYIFLMWCGWMWLFRMSFLRVSRLILWWIGLK